MGSIVDGSYLALVSNQSLRTTVIAGRPDRGHPDWRHCVPGEALSGAQVSDVVAWLVSQRPALPAPAVQLVDQLGVQLDALGLQLEGLDDKQPAVAEVRKLVGEHLPELVSTYTSIPRHLRGEARGGRSPDDELTASLGKISAEIDSVTRQLADGQIDKLAIRTRYLDYKYGDGVEETPTGTPT